MHGKTELAEIVFQKNGKYARIRCASRSVLPEDGGVCGFDGAASAVALYDNAGALKARESYLAGKLVERTELDQLGLPTLSVQVLGDRRITRTYFKDGKVRHEAAFTDGPTNKRQSRDGTISLYRQFDESGKQIKNEELHEDGSRKSQY